MDIKSGGRLSESRGIGCLTGETTGIVRKSLFDSQRASQHGGIRILDDAIRLIIGIVDYVNSVFEPGYGRHRFPSHANTKKY